MSAVDRTAVTMLPPRGDGLSVRELELKNRAENAEYMFREAMRELADKSRQIAQLKADLAAARCVR